MKNKLKKHLVNIWNNSIDFLLFIKDNLYYFRDYLFCLFHTPPLVLSVEETIKLIVNNNLSVSRFGDAEIKLLAGIDVPYQDSNKELQNKLIEVISSDKNKHLICLSNVLSDLSLFNEPAKKHWKKHLAYYRPYWLKHLKSNKIYGDAFITRNYIDLIDKSNSHNHFNSLKEIWNNKNIIFVEGEKSRLGVGNDLFENASSIIRILAPNRYAFNHYDNLLLEISKYNPTDYLILLALGPTATILAYDLAQKGYQAIDIGHVDIEYEWFKMGATHKVPVPNKFVNEAGAGAGVGDIDNEKYLSEIVCRF